MVPRLEDPIHPAGGLFSPPSSPSVSGPAYAAKKLMPRRPQPVCVFPGQNRHRRRRARVLRSASSLPAPPQHPQVPRGAQQRPLRARSVQAPGGRRAGGPRWRRGGRSGGRAGRVGPRIRAGSARGGRRAPSLPGRAEREMAGRNPARGHATWSSDLVRPGIIQGRWSFETVSTETPLRERGC